MNQHVRLWRGALALAALLWPADGLAQMHHHAVAAPDSTAHHPGEMDMSGMDMSGMDMGGMPMTGLYGPYAMTREASGTAWQPDAARHDGIHVTSGGWSAMFHGSADLVFDHQGGPRGDEKVFSDNMVMGMAQHPLGPGTLGLRSMFSLEPATIGKDGYPLLLQTGETADGVTPLVDRQHPHDLFMELAASWSIASGKHSFFIYGGLPGEPALGPPAFMHRFSGSSIPVAPITHHWLDSTHITFGVVTAGAVFDRVKLEASAFRGREPDQDRWGIETPELDSHSFRVSVNPGEHWALQASYGRVTSPEQLEPDVDQDRATVSAMYDGAWGDDGRWEGTLAWGQIRNRPGHVLDAFTAEAAATFSERHTIFLRAEDVAKDELFVAPDVRAGQVFQVGELTAGYRYDFWRREHFAIGAGGSGTLAFVPGSLADSYGSTPASALLFLRASVR